VTFFNEFSIPWQTLGTWFSQQPAILGMLASGAKHALFLTDPMEMQFTQLKGSAIGIVVKR